ncbi:MAG: NfeD family protein [Magnetococcales bacterium]|nr:NfeD family protein [Magnetococcales bacterium]
MIHIPWEMLTFSWDQMNHWHWGIVAVLLVILEVVSPAFFFLWLGVAAGLVGGLLFLFPDLGWKAQWLFFSGFSLVSLGVWHLLLKHRPTLSTRPLLNRRSSQYVDRILILSAPIQGGVGRIWVDDTSWKVSGPEADAGTRVRVVGMEGNTLQVELV